MYQNPNRNLIIPLIPLGTRFTTIFIMQHLSFQIFYLNKQRYPRNTSNTSSNTAMMGRGQNKPASIPMQKVRILNPIAFAAWHIQNLTIKKPAFVVMIIYTMQGRLFLIFICKIRMVLSLYIFLQIYKMMNSH